MADGGDLAHLRDLMREFTHERDWERHHDPRSLVMALTGEVGELAEILQWRREATLADLGEEPLHTRLGEEMADVLLYLVRLADVLDIDLRAAAERKMTLNRAKHPASPSEPSHHPTDGPAF